MALDFSMPAEWMPHARTWMAWPCRREAWDGPEGLARAKSAYAAVAKAISAFEPVVMAARPADAEEAGKASGREIFEVALDDSWARDIGPTFVTGPSGRAAVQWRFNAWGGKYAPFDRDAGFAVKVAEKTGVTLRQAPIICEGGAIHSDGQRTILTTEQCLLNPNRNPGLTKDDAEQVLRDFVGAERVIWLGEGFSDSETDGHVDNIACFAGGNRVILGVPDSKAHPDHAPVMEAKKRLKTAGLEVIELIQPQMIRHDRHGRLLQASYVNFYFCNGGLVMPSFDDAHDEQARTVLIGCFPDREIVTVPALDILAGGGGIHCITQQEPCR
jgi:agmatine deiminase